MNDITLTTAKFKVLWTDGYARETIADRVVAENLGRLEANAICERLQQDSQWAGNWWKIVPQDAHVWRGMAEFV
jgi:hypothetical protein